MLKRIYLFFVLMSLSIPTSVIAGEVTSSGPIMTSISIQKAEALWLEKNHDLEHARSQIDMAKADTLSAAQRPNPQLSYNLSSVGAGRDHRYLNGSDHVVRIEQTFERGNKRELRMESADLNLKASQQNYADFKRQSRTLLYQLYYQLLLAQEKLRITKDNAELFKKTIEAAQLKLDVGEISQAELSRVDLDKLRADNDVMQAQNNLKQAQVDLAFYIGEENNASLIEASDTWPKVLEKIYQKPINIETRADIKAALLKIRAAEANRELARAFKKRDVTIGAQVERNSLDLESNTIGFGISIPLMTGYGYEGEIARAETEYQLAEHELEHLRAQAISEINKAKGDLMASEERVLHYDDSLLKEANKVLQSAEFSYKQGAQSVMDFLDARRTYKVTQIEAMNARYDYAKSLSAWLFLSEEIPAP
jgi:cobalt-zinc-cadmium efflux system outer membrane protein